MSIYLSWKLNTCLKDVVRTLCVETPHANKLPSWNPRIGYHWNTKCPYANHLKTQVELYFFNHGSFRSSCKNKFSIFSLKLYKIGYRYRVSVSNDIIKMSSKCFIFCKIQFPVSNDIMKMPSNRFIFCKIHSKL